MSQHSHIYPVFYGVYVDKWFYSIAMLGVAMQHKHNIDRPPKE